MADDWELDEDLLQILSALLYILLAVIFVMWWWVFSRVFVHKKDNDSRSAFMLVMFLCIIVEMARTIDPFAERDLTSQELIRCGMQIETTLLLVLLLIAADAAAWLNYFAMEGLLIKPPRTYRNVLYIGATASVFLTLIVIIFYATDNDYYQGVVIGAQFSNLLLIVWALVSLTVSVVDVKSAINTVEQTGADQQLLRTGDVEHLPTPEETEYAKTTQKKAKRVAKYIFGVMVVLIFDVCIGVPITGGKADVINLVYGICIKLLILAMLWQRRPVRGGRQYEKDAHTRYKPFETFMTGDTATRTVKDFKKMCRTVTSLMPGDGMANNQNLEPSKAQYTSTQGIAMTNITSLGDDEAELPVTAPVEATMEARSSTEMIGHRRMTSLKQHGYDIPENEQRTTLGTKIESQM